MTLSLDLVNKYSLSSSCVPSARITHNPGTQVHHNQAGRKAEMWTLTHYQRPKEGKGKGAIYGHPGGGGGITFSWAGQEGFTKKSRGPERWEHIWKAGQAALGTLWKVTPRPVSSSWPRCSIWWRRITTNVLSTFPSFVIFPRVSAQGCKQVGKPKTLGARRSDLLTRRPNFPLPAGFPVKICKLPRPCGKLNAYHTKIRSNRNESSYKIHPPNKKCCLFFSYGVPLLFFF